MIRASRAYAAVQRNPMMTIAFVLGFALILVVGLRGESTRNIITSNCEVDPNGKKCQKVKRASDEQRNISSTCVLFYKVDRGGKLLRLTKCEVREPEETKGSLESGRVAEADADGARRDAIAPQGSGGGDRGPIGEAVGGGGEQPAGDEGGSEQPDVPGQGGSGEPTVPVDGGSTPAPAPAPSATKAEPTRPSTPPPATTPPPSSPESRTPSLLPENLIPDTVTAAGEAVGKTTEGAQGVVGETGKAVDCVLRGGC